MDTPPAPTGPGRSVSVQVLGLPELSALGERRQLWVERLDRLGATGSGAPIGLRLARACATGAPDSRVNRARHLAARLLVAAGTIGAVPASVAAALLAGRFAGADAIVSVGFATLLFTPLSALGVAWLVDVQPAPRLGVDLAAIAPDAAAWPPSLQALALHPFAWRRSGGLLVATSPAASLLSQVRARLQARRETTQDALDEVAAGREMLTTLARAAEPRAAQARDALDLRRKHLREHAGHLDRLTARIDRLLLLLKSPEQLVHRGDAGVPALLAEVQQVLSATLLVSAS